MRKQNTARALWVLAAAGGAWAWQNRDKIRGFIDQQRSHRKSSTGTYPNTSVTQRMDANVVDLPQQDDVSRKAPTFDPSL